MANILKIIPLILPAFLLASCSTNDTQFTKYQGNDIMLGHGGVERSYNGIDIWTYGSPDRKFKIIGVIDKTPNQGNGFMNTMKQLSSKSMDSQLASAAKLHGGNAVIIMLQENERDIFGDSTSAVGAGNHSGLGEADSNGDATAQHDHPLKAYIIKYVDEKN